MVAARRILEDARERVAALVDARPDQVVFTGGGTEANALALGGSGRYWWFLNGVPLAERVSGQPFDQAFSRAGRYQLSVLDEAGQTARVEFEVAE